jgi:TolB-like protein/tetratricopeptide (TPR) repeat protein
MASGNFFTELKRRNVMRMAGLYLVGAWLLTQVASTVLPMFGTPDWLPRSIVILLAIGFVPALIFSWVFELTPEGIKRDAEVAPEKSIAPQTARRMDRMIIVVLVLALGYFAFDKFVLGPRRNSPPNEPAALSDSKSIAVLPLVNTSGDPNNDYFSDGLSEELIAVLAKIPELKVIGRSSSFFFKGKSGESASIGQKLGVAHLLEGSVRKQGDRVRIVAELIRAADGRSLWSETYDRELKDVFAVQAEIARAVVEQMKLKLLGERILPDGARSSENPAAHNAVLQAHFYFQQQTSESVRQAIRFLETAVRLDPNYALAYARLAQAWRQYAASFSTEATGDTEQSYNEARHAAERAVSLAPDLIETRMAVGLVAANPDLDFRTAEKEFRRVLQLAPSDAAAKSALSYALLSQGRLTEAEQSCREAISLDPLLTNSWYNIGRVVVGLGRYQEAEQLFRKGIEIQPHASRFHSYLVLLDIVEDRLAQATTDAQLESEGFWRDYAVSLAQQAQSDRSATDPALKNFIANYSQTAPFQIAVLYAIRKEPEEMFKWLEAAYATRDSGLSQMAVTPFFLPYARDQRFIALCQRLNVQPPAPAVKP